MAVTAFAASLDALAGGGAASGIKDFIENRLGFARSDRLLRNGQSASEFVNRVYDSARSQFVHGSSTHYAEDWQKMRGSAEAVGRLCLVAALDWVEQHPSVTDVKRLRQP